MNLEFRVVVSEDVLSRQVEGETVLLDMKSESYFGLDEVGTRVWQLLDAGQSLRVVYDTLIDEYEVAGERLEKDLLTLLGEMADAGLISLRAPADVAP